MTPLRIPGPAIERWARIDATSGGHPCAPPGVLNQASVDDRRRQVQPSSIHDHVTGARRLAQVITLRQLLPQVGAAVGELRVELITDALRAPGTAAHVQAGHWSVEARSDV